MIKSLFDDNDEKKIRNETDKSETLPEDITTYKEYVAPEDINLEEAEKNESAGNFLKETSLDDVQPAFSYVAKNEEPEINFVLSNSYEQASTGKTSPAKNDEPMLFQTQTKPESNAETARKSGLAMSAAIALFGSVVFLLIIGWFADLLLGTSPWGIVAGIVLGSIIGFVQFFRTTSQILEK